MIKLHDWKQLGDERVHFILQVVSPSSLEVSRDLKAEADAGAMFSYNTQDYQPRDSHLKKCPTGLPVV